MREIGAELTIELSLAAPSAPAQGRRGTGDSSVARVQREYDAGTLLGTVVALHSSGRGEDAMVVLKESLARHPGDRDTLLALISFGRDAGDFATALEYAEQLVRLTPNDPNVKALIESLRSRIKKPEAQ